MGQRAAKKWARRAGPRWREERLRVREAKRLKQHIEFLKRFYAPFVPAITEGLCFYGDGVRRVFDLEKP